MGPMCGGAGSEMRRSPHGPPQPACTHVQRARLDRATGDPRGTQVMVVNSSSECSAAVRAAYTALGSSTRTTERAKSELLVKGAGTVEEGALGGLMRCRQLTRCRVVVW
jgi:hypothetical protein